MSRNLRWIPSQSWRASLILYFQETIVFLFLWLFMTMSSILMHTSYKSVIAFLMRLWKYSQITKSWVLLNFQGSSLMIKPNVLTLSHYFDHQFLFFDGVLNNLDSDSPLLQILMVSCFHFCWVRVFAHQVFHLSFKPKQISSYDLKSGFLTFLEV